MLGSLAVQGYAIARELEDADVAVVNTCSFIESAREESIEAILEVADLRDQGRLRALVVAGCLPQRYGAELAKELPEVDAFVGTGAFQEIAPILDDALAGRSRGVYVEAGRTHLYDEHAPRILTGAGHSAYVKIAEGCDRVCAFCAIPGIRGGFQSRTLESVVAEAHQLAEAGVREINLVAQDSTSWGKDLQGRRPRREPQASEVQQGRRPRSEPQASEVQQGRRPREVHSEPKEAVRGSQAAQRPAQATPRSLSDARPQQRPRSEPQASEVHKAGRLQLSDLLRALDEVAGLDWIRQLYLYPSAVTDELIEVMAGAKRVLRYVDIPLQHASDRMLQAMRRGTTAERQRRLLARLRAAMPDVTLRTTLIVGFPGETEADFEELLAFVREERFDRLGVFRYSDEEDTAARQLGEKVPRAVARERWRRVTELQRGILRDKLAAQVGREADVLVDSTLGGGIGLGRLASQAPEIDGVVFLKGAAAPGDLVRARLTGLRGDCDLEAEELPDPSLGAGSAAKRRRQRQPPAR
jgi:ribosomal protein S12 methylthiotransferase